MKLYKKFHFAIKGIAVGLKEERSLRIQLWFAILAVVLGLYFKIQQTEWIFIAFAIFLVMALELINTAIEAVIDVIKPRLSPGVERIKDFMAGGVLLISLGAVVAGIIIFLPHILALIF